jgi:predicted PurR-regulated permease PerM
MLGIDSRALRAVWTTFLFAAGVAIIYIVRGTLVTFALAIFFALLLAPIVALVERVSPAWLPRTAALAIVYVLLLAGIAAATVPLGTAVMDDARALADKLPSALGEDSLRRLPLPAFLEPARDRIATELSAHVDDFERNAFPIMGRAFEQVLSGIGTVARVVFVPILAFFLLKDGRSVYGRLITGIGGQYRMVVNEIYSDLRIVLAQYVRALMLLALITFVSYAAFLALTGAPYAVLLAGIAAVLEIVPAVGPFIGAILILTVVLISGYTKWVLLLTFLVIYRVFLDYMVQPTLMGAGVQVHPVLVLFGALAGAEIGGIAGIFFSIPVIAALRVIVLRLHRAREISHG